MTRSRPLTIGAIWTLLFAATLGFVPSFGGPGYEVALAYGIVLPSTVAIAVARHSIARELAPFDALGQGVAVGASYFAIAFGTALLHGMRLDFCDPMSGLEVVLLGPGAGCLLAGAWGAIAAEAARFVRAQKRRFVASLAVALGGPLSCVVVSVGRFYTSPMIFAYDPFVGYFSGSIYDTVLEYGRLLTYRVGTAATLLALVVLALHLGRSERGTLRLRWIQRPGVLLLGVCAACVSLLMTVEGASFDHFHDRSTISRELGAQLDGGRCLVIYARSLKEADVRRFAGECEAHVIENEAWWGARGPDKITAFLFEDEGQKARLMGAAGTNIAKPWRAEIYVQSGDFPHRVLGHELMHVIASSDGRGPFRVAGDVGGLLPNPGLIEGVAVAASPKDEELSPIEWAKVMKDLGILPPLARLFALGFIGENSTMAYTVSGAFVGFVHDRYGAEAVRAWYRGTPIAAATGVPMAELEAAFHAELDQLSLPEAAQIQGRAKFDRPGFFARRCPRFVDGCRERASALLASGDYEGAFRELTAARAFEPDNPSLRLEEAEAMLEHRSDATLLQALADDDAAPRHARDRALETLADRALSDGQSDRAAAIYRELVLRTIDEGRLRTLYVKLAAATDEALRRPIVLLLVGEHGKKPDRAAAFALVGLLERDQPDNGLAPYLFGRYFWDSGDNAQAVEQLGRALARKITVPRVRAEALRLTILAASAEQECETAAQALDQYRQEPGVPSTKLETAARVVKRCSLARAALN